MLKHWKTLFNTRCEVVKIGEHFVYPIYRNGSTSLKAEAELTISNREISKCDNIKIIMRDPNKRFISGVNQYCALNNLSVETVYDSIIKEEIIDRHFAPQFVWLTHLYSYYRGSVTLLPFEAIKEFTSKHRSNKLKKTQCNVIEKLVATDKKLMKYLGTKIQLDYLVRKYADEMS